MKIAFLFLMILQHRILDANLNRSREALRVLEEYCRFLRNHSRWTTQFKHIRHSLVQFEQTVGIEALLAARHLDSDVGTAIQGTNESQRNSLFDVLRANFNRLKEATRVLEEYGKQLSFTLGCQLEQIRYQIYQLEQEILLSQPKKQLTKQQLYCIFAPSACSQPYLEVLKQLVDGGIEMLQLREKELEAGPLLELAYEIGGFLQPTEVLYFINDRPDIAALVGADGVHVGQQDLPLTQVKRLFPHLIVGVSTCKTEQAIQANEEGADYIGLGPIFSSKTKRFDAFVGLEYLRDAFALFSGPKFPIGGISLANLDSVLEAGARRVAVSSALLQAEHIEMETKQFQEKLKNISLY